MEAIHLLLKSQQEETSAQLSSITESLKELKTENAFLKKELLGFFSSNVKIDSGGLLEKKTLRDILEDIQYEVKAIKAQVSNGIRDHKNLKKRNSGKNLPEGCLQLHQSNGEEVLKYPEVGISNKTASQERESLELKFKGVRGGLSDPADGVSLMGTTLERISEGIPLTQISTTSCVIQLSNYLHSTLTDPEDYIVPGRGKKISGPVCVNGHTREVIAVEGGERWCSFLSSFGISEDLRLAFTTAVARVDGCIFMGIGFVPKGTPTDSNLLSLFFKGPSMPDFLAHGYTVARGPVEGYVIHGRYLARAHMTHGHRAIMNVEVVEVEGVGGIGDGINYGDGIIAEGRSIRTGEYTSASIVNRPLGSANPCSSDGVACVVEIVNGLNVSLQESRRFIRSCKHNNFMPYQILPFTREVFFASSDEVVEAMFACKIESTDLALVVGLRAHVDGNNAFAGAFVLLPAITNKNAYKALMEPGPSKNRLYRRAGAAKDGEQVIQIRNIRATLRMTEDIKSVLKIRIFAV